MSATLAQIITFATSEAYRANSQGTLKSYSSLLREATGQVKSYHGATIQNPAEGYVLNIWDEPASYDVISDKSQSAHIVAAFENAAKGSVTTIHARFKEDPRMAVASPITELALITMKEGHTRASIASHMDAFVSLGVPPVGMTWGPVIGHDDMLVLVAGWDSVEAHQEYLRSPPEKLSGLAGALLLASSWKVLEAHIDEAV